MAETGRADYDHLIQFKQLEPGEPSFFIRGRDQVGGATVRAWAALASKAGAEPAIVESALQQADRLDEWPRKKLPDANHLQPAERQALEYQLQRRAWSHRIAHVPNEAIILAEARGARAAIARERHADALLVDLVDSLAPVLAQTTASSEQLKRLRAALRLVAEDLALRHGTDLEKPAETAPAQLAPIVPFIRPAAG